MVIAWTKRTDALDELTRTVVRSESARGLARAVCWLSRFETPRRLFDSFVTIDEDCLIISLFDAT